MQRYIVQLLEDLAEARLRVAADLEAQPREHLWISEEDEAAQAPGRDLEAWTGIGREALPPQELLDDAQVLLLLNALVALLDAANCLFVMQFSVPPRVQYEAIRLNFRQRVKLQVYHMGFFDHCGPDTEHQRCALGAWCHCAYFEELFAGFVHEDLTPEEERRRRLAVEIEYLKRKHGDRWMRYYPYHLDPDHDDAYGNPSTTGGRTTITTRMTGGGADRYGLRLTPLRLPILLTASRWMTIRYFTGRCKFPRAIVGTSPGVRRVFKTDR
ncbi:hypothetical protein [Flaviaesturariibacter amylovorans]|uniref:Uncharacterized protein n=1 Tax=Flaviaesturariibacter amylovorans TaxID=1084520 RepID=A0ABP8HR67_9BACT